MADTQALVNKQAGEKTAEQARRAITNPFTLAITEAGVLTCAMGKQKPVEIGQMVSVGGGKFIVEREGTALNKGGASMAQVGRSDAAYYALRNLLSRAATRDIDPVTKESAQKASEKVAASETRATVAERRFAVLTGLQLSDMTGITPADVALLAPELVARLPEDKQALLASVK